MDELSSRPGDGHEEHGHEGRPSPLSRRRLLGGAGAATLLAWLAACGSEEELPGGVILNRIVGDPRPDGFTVSARTQGAGAVRLRIGSSPALSQTVAVSSSSTPDSDGWSHTTVSGLEPGGEYYFDLEEERSDGTRAFRWPGRAKTLPVPGRPASFGFAFGSCMTSGADDRSVMDRILARDPLFFLHLGDFGYFDNDSDDAADHRRDFESQLAANPGLRQVLAEIPTFYIQSDHDAGGGNNAGPGPWTAANRTAYRQIFPHPDVSGHEDGLYWAVPVGRVRMIFTDHKTYASPGEDDDSPSKSMLGPEQKEWFFAELGQPEPVKIWVQHSPFIDTEEDGDKWGNYATEQSEIAEVIRTRAVGEVVTVHGDMHAVAVSTQNPWDLRSWSAAPFHQRSSHKGGPWTQGPYPEEDEADTRQYGFVTVEDDGQSIVVSFAGYDHDDEAHVSDSFTVTDPR